MAGRPTRGPTSPGCPWTPTASSTWLPSKREIAKDPDAIALSPSCGPTTRSAASSPVDEVVALADPHGIPVHSDAVQAFTSVPVAFADSGLATMAVSGHKIGGPGGHRRPLRAPRRRAHPRAARRRARTRTALGHAERRRGTPASPPRPREVTANLAGRKRAPGHAARRADRRRRASWSPRPCFNGTDGPGSTPAPGSRATRTSPSRAARATRCSSCWTCSGCTPPPARPAPPGCRGPPTCCWPWAGTRTTARGAQRFSSGIQPAPPTLKPWWPPCPRPMRARKRPAWPHKSAASKQQGQGFTR